MATTEKKSEVVYCRFRPGIYSLVKARAVVWSCSNAEAIERLAFIGEVSTWASESMAAREEERQGGSALEVEALLNKILGPVRVPE